MNELLVAHEVRLVRRAQRGIERHGIRLTATSRATSTRSRLKSNTTTFASRARPRITADARRRPIYSPIRAAISHNEARPSPLLMGGARPTSSGMHTDAPTPSSPSCPPATPGVLRYQRHRPEDSVLYALVEQHRPAFQRSLAERERPLPGFVLDEFRRYLACGRLEHSFIRVKCDGCRHELLVAFSCKKRGFCPSDLAVDSEVTTTPTPPSCSPDEPFMHPVYDTPCDAHGSRSCVVSKQPQPACVDHP